MKPFLKVLDKIWSFCLTNVGVGATGKSFRLSQNGTALIHDKGNTTTEINLFHTLLNQSIKLCNTLILFLVKIASTKHLDLLENIV